MICVFSAFCHSSPGTRLAELTFCVIMDLIVIMGI